MVKKAVRLVGVVACSLVAAACAPRVAGELHEAPPEWAQDALDETFDDARRARSARGAIGLLLDGGTRWELASGTANADGMPAAANMRFRIGSITKPIIAALALDQVEQGALSLDRDITRLVGPPLRTSPPVTLRNLLNHTSGIFDIGNEGDPVADVPQLTDVALLEEVQELYVDADDGKQVVASDRLTIGLAETHDRYFPPGTGYHYSNTNYQVVGLALGEVTGRSLAQLLESRITGPLGLADTSLAPDDRTTPDLHGYVTDSSNGRAVDVTNDLLALGNGAGGGIISTPDDLLAIMTELVHGSLLPGDLRVRMQTPTRQSGGTYGLGLAVYDLSCGRFYGHEGRVNGTVSIAVVDADRADRGFVATFNSTDDQTGLTGLAETLLCRSGSSQ